MKQTEQMVDEVIDAWHDGGYDRSVELHEALGWTEEQYLYWVQTNIYPEIEVG